MRTNVICFVNAKSPGEASVKDEISIDKRDSLKMIIYIFKVGK
jgi:hypothetical protein